MVKSSIGLLKAHHRSEVPVKCSIFVIPITLIIMIFLNYVKLFFLKVDMLYNIFEALHPFPNLKDILFSEFLGKWNRSGLSER